MWIDKEKKDGDLMTDAEVVDEVLRDEEEIERQEGYELEYNFRHEENAEDRVIVYSRTIEGSVRKKESKRKSKKGDYEDEEHEGEDEENDEEMETEECPTRYQQKMRIKELLKEKRNGKKGGRKRSRDAAEPSTSRLGGGKEDEKA
ncbi:hypothetical protein PTKIN_Ptkin01aG0282300 [Pterospermum kingtungense]